MVVVRVDLSSMEARLLKERIRKLLGASCARCDWADPPLDIHHRSNHGGNHRDRFGGLTAAYYKDILRLIEEGSKEFELLCRDCHGAEHSVS